MESSITSNGVVYRVLNEAGGVAVSRNEGDTQRFQVQSLPDGTYIIEGADVSASGYAVRDGNKTWVHLNGRTYRFDIVRSSRGRPSAAPGDLSSPMPGQVQRVLVIEGDAVQAGQTLLVVEAMKMQLEIKAPHGGTVRRVLARQGQQVEAGVALVELDEIVPITPGKPGS